MKRISTIFILSTILFILTCSNISAEKIFDDYSNKISDTNREWHSLGSYSFSFGNTDSSGLPDIPNKYDDRLKQSPIDDIIEISEVINFIVKYSFFIFFMFLILFIIQSKNKLLKKEIL